METDDEGGTSRRRFVERTGGALGAGLLASAAGCIGLSDGGSESEGPLFAENLVLRYDFEEGSGSTVRDTSGNGNDGEATGGTRADGKVGQGFELDGEDDLVSTPVTYEQLGAAGGLSFVAWARHDDLTAGYGWVFTQTAASDQWSQMGVFGGGDGALRFELVMEEGQATIDAPAGSVQEGTWHHWVGTWAEGAGLRLYIDGERVATSAESTYCARGCEFATGPLGATEAINVGAQGRKAEYWVGAVDDVRIYDRALSAEEVSRLYGKTK